MMIHPAQVVAPFIAPALAWAGVALVSVPVAIHLLSRWRRKPQPWGAMRFLLEAYRKQKQRMRMEQWLLLILRCLVVLVLGLALSRPLLVGALGSWFGGMDSGGRVVNLVIDDAMSLQAGDGPDTIRFERLIAAAGSVIDALEPGDRATVWRAGRPAEPVIAEPTGDRAELRRALSGLRPGYSRTDVPAALTAVTESTRDGQDVSAQSVTFLFSDFARSSRYIEQPADPGLLPATGTNDFVVMRPLAGVNNVQVMSVKPGRRVLWVGGLSDTVVAAEVRLSRYSQALGETTVGVVADLINPQGKVLASERRRVTFANGQVDATLGIDIPIGASPAWLQAQGGTFLTICARLDGVNDELIADNQA
ncbi:MAG: BatA domain-containing protein, partial [Phycisphaerales bacterium]